MTNQAIGYLDGYTAKEAAPPHGQNSPARARQGRSLQVGSLPPSEKLTVPPGPTGPSGVPKTPEQEQAVDEEMQAQLRGEEILKNDFLYGVATSETKRKLAAAGITGGIGAILGGLMGGGKGAAQC